MGYFIIFPEGFAKLIIIQDYYCPIHCHNKLVLCTNQNKFGSGDLFDLV